jgi:four helix bundle protein
MAGRFGLTAQLRRAAISVPSNIAEGAARGTAKEFAQFLIIARASLSEIETQLIISTDLRYLSQEVSDQLADTVDTAFALIGGLLRSVRRGPTGP